MYLVRLILAPWALYNQQIKPKVLEGVFSLDDIKNYNNIGYNVFYFPNAPTDYSPDQTVDGSQIDKFEWCFVDYDTKSGTLTKEEFIQTIRPEPTKVVDSGHGIHAYWRIKDMDGMSYLRFERRLTRMLNTDTNVGRILQPMRLPGTINVKNQQSPLPCELLLDQDVSYTMEEFDKLLPAISKADEEFCRRHYDTTYSLKTEKADASLPANFGQFLTDFPEAKDIWSQPQDDRSKSDFRLGHLMFANGFTKDEATRVLMNSVKASQRAPIHRQAYASNIVDKIWTYEENDDLSLSSTVRETLQKSNGTMKGTRFPCHPRIDNTVHGYRLGQVLGLVAGSGVGKTSFAMNMFRWFAQKNPDYNHFFIPLEQPAAEIADRWQTMCGADTSLHDKVHIISNYDDEGQFRHLSFEEIKAYILKFQEKTGKKIGCIVVDHIGALKKKGKDGENQDLMDICHAMKAFAVQTNTFLVMQSQASRVKAGIGDLELDKDAAYGTVYFESYCDYLVTLWQPVKRCHKEQSCPTVTAFKFCKIRHKKAREDIIQEDAAYFLAFDSDNELMHDMTQDQQTSFKYWLTIATRKRSADRKTELVDYQPVPYSKDEDGAKGTRFVTKH